MSTSTSGSIRDQLRTAFAELECVILRRLKARMWMDVDARDRRSLSGIGRARDDKRFD